MPEEQDEFFTHLAIATLFNARQPTRTLPDGRVLRLEYRTFGNMLLTISNTLDDPTWFDGW